MTIRAHITQHHFGDAIKIFIVDHRDYGRFLLHYKHEDRSLRWDEVGEEGAALVDEPPPTMELPRDSGRALLDELTRFYNGAEDTRALRRDYDAERRRVDEQTKTIADIARMLAGRTVL